VKAFHSAVQSGVFVTEDTFGVLDGSRQKTECDAQRTIVGATEISTFKPFEDEIKILGVRPIRVLAEAEVQRFADFLEQIRELLHIEKPVFISLDLEGTQ
jgi:hypothetical protein